MSNPHQPPVAEFAAVRRSALIFLAVGAALCAVVTPQPAAAQPMAPARASSAPRASPARKPAAKTTAPRKSPKKAPANGKTTVPGDVPESGTELFPTRVWPD